MTFTQKVGLPDYLLIHNQNNDCSSGEIVYYTISWKNTTYNKNEEENIHKC